jgi:selenocysteine-specific translation elongation factor
MEHRIISLLGDLGWTSSIGKKSSETSFTTYSLKKDDRLISLIEASKYPDKVWSLLFSLYLSDQVMLRIDRIDRELGETLIALDLLGKRSGFKYISEEVDISRLDAVMKGNIASDYPTFDPDPSSMRDWLFTQPLRSSSGPTMVVVDQSFNVKGVGCVVLGFVMSGTVKRHQELVADPGGHVTQVRSIQIHDIDMDEAPNGARVGLAMKNIGPEELPRGSVLSDGKANINVRTELDLNVRPSPFWKGGLEAGMRLHALSSLQFIPCLVTSVGTPAGGALPISLKMESSIWTRPGDKVGLVHLDSKSFRFFAAGETL